MRILYFLSAVVLAVVLIVGCTGEQPGVVEPVQKAGMVPPPADFECDPPCVNGSCVLFGDLICICDEGWTGAACDVPADPCDPNPCQNGGQCGDNGDGSYTCTCAPGYTGANCETDIDECEANPCVNGDCTDLVNGYECSCLPGWTGTNCDEPEVTDDDNDGVPNDNDTCPGTASGDVVDATGCSIAQHCPCDGDWKNHGKYVSCVAHSAQDFVDAGLITEAEKGSIVSAAAQSNCGKKK